MLTGLLVFACASTNAAHARGRRQVSDTLKYEGTFPVGKFSARRSIFADPRYQQGMDPSILRRYKHMEKLINFYDQSITNITKYWTYGCWCFQMGDFPLRLGNGSPVDNVDKICKRHKECYQCAKKDAGTGDCLPEETGYRFAASFDGVTGATVVQCLNPEGSCRRNICECDKAFASRLPQAAESSDGWNGAHHAHYGGFDSRSSCLARIHTPGSEHKVECCGEYPDRFPYRFAKDNSGKQCCGATSIFSQETHDCCDDDVVRTNGSC